MSKMLVTIAYGNYWDLYGERFENMCDALEEKPDRILVISDIAINTKFENEVYNPKCLDNYAINSYRQRAYELCDCDWLIQFDIDDMMYPNYISNIDENYDCHLFLVKNNESVMRNLHNVIRNFSDLDEVPLGGYMNSAYKMSALRKIGGYKLNFGWEDVILLSDLIHSKCKFNIDMSVMRGERLLKKTGSITSDSNDIKDTKVNETKKYLKDLRMISRMHEIERLYKMILSRDADESGLINYLNSNLSLYDIQNALWTSDEFKNKFNPDPYEPTELNNELPIFVINLERRPDRKFLIETRLSNLGIKNYEIVKAVDGIALPDDTSKIYNEETSIQLHRLLMKTEIACALSHIQIAKKIVDENIEYAIVLEDDAELTPQFKQFIKDFNLKSNKFDFLILGSFSSNQFFNGKLKTKESPYTLIEKESITYLDNIEFSIGQTTIHKTHYPSQTLDYVHGTHAYMLSNAGARKLLELNYPVVVEADNVWNYFYDKCSTLFTNPILVHRQHQDSDIREQRKHLDYAFEEYSINFRKRKYHDDFGS